MFAPFSPAISPATKPPQPAFDTAAPPLPGPVSPPFDSPPPPLPPLSPAPSAPPVTSPVTTAPPTPSSTVPLPTNSAPPVTSPATSSPPTVSSTPPLPANSAPPVTSTVPLPTNSAPPVASPEIPAPPVWPSPSPESSHVPTSSSPPNTSNEIPDSSTLSPPVMSLPPVMPLPSPLPPASQPPPFPPSTVAATPPTVTFSPPSTSTLPEEMPPPPPLPIPFTEPPLSSRPTPVSSPEVNLRPTSSSRSLPVAVEVQRPSGFNVSSGLIVGVVIGAIFFVFVLAIVSVLCRNRKKKKKKKQKNWSLHHQKESSSPCVGSKGSHVIRVPSNPTLPPHLTEDGGLGRASDSVNSGSVRTIPNQAPSIAFGPVNGIFAYEELEVATKYFAESNLLGEGGFGYVYKGVLPCGKEIAVKQLKAGSQQGEREFQAEVETISRVHHKHLVELVGYCINRAERLLVYEFVPNNTLEFHLHGEGKAVMEWATRVKIALGSAKGLAYLHEDCNPAIIHRDIKASNILLDLKFEAKVSDFGLAKIFPNTDSCITHLTTRVVGTFGYLAPEYASSGKLTDKSDVYSYGVMLLELITGRPPITAVGSRNESLVDWARPLLAQALQNGNFNNLVDPRLQKNYEADEMARMITCAAACVRHSARLRPRMSQIVGALEGLVSLTDIVGDITPGHTTLYSWSDNSDYDASQYQQHIRNFNLASSCQKYSSSGHSESTSAYGLYPSASSSEVQEAIRDRDQR